MALAINTCVQSYLTQLQQANWKHHLLNQWPTIAGKLQTKVWIYKITDASIVLGVTSSSWMQELYILSHVLLKKINSCLDKPRIQKIYFKLLQEYQYKKTASKKQVRTKKTSIRQPLSAKHQQALQTIKDEALATALSNFLYTCQSQ